MPAIDHSRAAEPPLRPLSGARRRLARALAPARWEEYREFLAVAWGEGYRIVPLEQWVLEGCPAEELTLVLRHDVDQHARSALKMASVERAVGVRSTWYFRWRTADRSVIRRLRRTGHSVGLHYETATRLALAGRSSEQPIDDVNGEVAAFESRFGPIHSISAHGDTRVPDVSNGSLTEGVDPAALGVAFDATHVLAGRPLGFRLTDRHNAGSPWRDAVDPAVLFEQGVSPIFCLTHPNNWVGGATAGRGRVRIALRRLVGRNPDNPSAARRRAARTGVAGPPFAPIATDLERLVADQGRRHGVSGEALAISVDINGARVEERGRLIVDALREGFDRDDLVGLRVADLGCGFGALALLLGTYGASVTGVDAKPERVTAGRQVAQRHGVECGFAHGRLEQSGLGDDGFDAVLLNNSLCYVVDRPARAAALTECLRILRPGGMLVVRNANRLRLRDPFTGLPLIHLLPPRHAVRVARALGRSRSHVRLLSSWGIKRELRRAGFSHRRHFKARTSPWPTVLRTLAVFQNVTARAPQ